MINVNKKNCYHLLSETPLRTLKQLVIIKNLCGLCVKNKQ